MRAGREEAVTVGSDEDEQSIPTMRDKARGVAETAGGKVKELTG